MKTKHNKRIKLPWC